MNKKTILSSLIFAIPLTFVDPKKPEFLSELKNKNLNSIDIINKNHSQSITNFSYSKKNIIEIKSCWGKRDLASQKSLVLLQHNQFITFNL